MASVPVMPCVVPMTACPWAVVLWDFDGTLSDTARDVWVSLDYAAERCGRRLSDELERSGESLALSMQELFSWLVPPADPKLFGAFDADVTRHYRTLSPHEHTELFPGIRELVFDLRAAGASCRIVTNKPQGALERILVLKGWAELFDGWECSDSAGEGALSKAQMMCHALASERVAPECCVMVGDSAGDVFGAHEAGMVSIGVTYGDGNVDELLAAGPDFVACDTRELREILLEG